MSERDPMRMPLDGLRLVEASAGTGKTFSLTGLYLRLVLEKGLTPRDILVMTFTRAATQELRGRIRSRIAGAARLAADAGLADPVSAEDRFALELLERHQEPRDALAARLREAALRMDEASINTIHGFCQQALSENAFDSAVAFDRGEQGDDRALFAEAVADYWRGRVFGKDTAEAASVLGYWNDPGALAADIGWVVDNPQLRLAGPEPEEARELAANVRAQWWAHSPELQALLERAEREDGLHGGRKLQKAVTAAGGVAELFRRIGESLQAGTPHPETLAPLATDTLPKQLKGAAAKAGVPAELTAPVDALLRLPALQRAAMIREAADAVAALLAERKRERRLHSFADLIQSLYRAVTDPVRGSALAAALRRRWPWALVDEFQDTDPMQYAILRAVYHGIEDVGLVVIGDPKQAIYGFRGGDVFAYLRAARDAREHYTLDTNHRSTAGVLQAIEALFTLPSERPFIFTEIEFRPVRAGRNDGDRVIVVDGQPLPALTLWPVEPEESDGTVAAGEARERAGAATAARIRELLDPERGTCWRQPDEKDRPLTGSDICVLVNSNAEASAFQARLARMGVPAVCQHQSSVFATEQAAQLQRVLEAAAAPTDPRRLRAALITELFGLRLRDLLVLADDDRALQQEMDRLQQAHARWARDGVLALLEPLIQHAAPRLLVREDGERCITNWLHLAELAQQAEAATFGMGGLIRWLSDARRGAAEGDAAEESLLRLESDEQLVRIATVHKVKGLQFSVVMLPYAPFLGTGGGTRNPPTKPPFRYHDETGELWLDPGIGEDEAHAPLAVRERRAEAVRLLYVALTRASQAIFLPLGAINGAQNGALAWLFHQRDGAAPEVWITRKDQWAEWFRAATIRERVAALADRFPGVISVEALPDAGDRRPAALPVRAELGPARVDLPEARIPWQMLSYSSLVRGGPAAPAARGGAEDEPRVAADSDAVDSALEGLSGTGFGTAVHAILEDADFAVWPQPGKPPEAELQALVTGHLLHQGIVLPEGEAARGRVLAVAGLVSRCLHTPLPGIGPLAAVPVTRRLAEMGFAMRLGDSHVNALDAVLTAHGYPGVPAEPRPLNGLLQGYVDLVVEHDGRYWVIDYKTNHLGTARNDYRPGRLADAVHQGHYALQYLLYLVALHRHLALRLPGYDPERHLGGAQYLFLRGMNGRDAETGVFVDRPGADTIVAIDRVLDGAGESR